LKSSFNGFGKQRHAAPVLHKQTPTTTEKKKSRHRHET